MGCTSSHPEGKLLMRVPTLFGSLHINVLNCHLERNPNSIMSMDPYVKITISNQTRTTQIKKKGGFDPRYD